MNTPFRRTPLGAAHCLVTVFFLCCLAGCRSLSSPEDSSRLIYLGKTLGPATQIEYALPSGETGPLLANENWRDLHLDVASDGRVLFMSNRREQSGIDLSQRREHFQIFVLNPGQSEPEALTNLAHSAMAPRYGPGERRVGFLSAGPDRTTLKYLPAPGQSPVSVLAARDILDYAWSPDGDRMAAVLFEPGDSHLALVSLSETETAPVTIKAEEPGAVITAVSWSPDGGALSYIVNSPDDVRRLYLYDLASGRRTLLSDPANHVQQPVHWSSDGQTLLYSSLVDFEFFYDEEKREQVYRGSMQVFLTDRRGNRQRITRGAGRHGAPVFSPDGERIAFLYSEKLDARTLSLRTVNLEGKDERILHENVAPESSLQWTSTTSKNRR